MRLPEDDANASKHVGVLTVYHMYIYICVCVCVLCCEFVALHNKLSNRSFSCFCMNFCTRVNAKSLFLKLAEENYLHAVYHRLLELNMCFSTHRVHIVN
jgi:hypothetical protein